jgi:hypothetical protein
MQSLSIWHWIIIAILIVLVVCAIWLFARAINNRRPHDRSVKDSSSATVTGPSGFGGWLVLLAIGVFVSPILTIYSASQLENGVDDATLQRFRLTFNGEIGIFLLVALLQICTAFFMARRARRFVPFYIVTGIATILLTPADTIWAASMLSLQSGRPFQPILQAVAPSPADIGRWISTGVGVGIWMLYVIRSRRVGNTFVR